jgi:hypothetical protein
MVDKSTLSALLRVGFDGRCKAVAEQSFLVEFGAFLWTDNYYRTTREMGS